MSSRGSGFKNLVEEEFIVDPDTALKFKLDEVARSGALKLGMRVFKTGGEYVGPTRDGLTLTIETKEEAEALEKVFTKFIQSVKKELDK